MGLAERRALAEYQEKNFPSVKKEVDASAGFPVEMDIHWDTMAEPEQGAIYGEIFGKVYFTPLIDALKAIGVDAMGKQALQKGLKKIVVDGSEGHSAGSFSFEDGVLKIQHQPYVNLDDVSDRKQGIQKLLEEKL